MSSKSADQPETAASRHPWLGRRAVVRRLPSFGGTIGAVAFYSVSLTPSLLPRPWWLQATVAGVTATIGYVVGALIALVVRSFGFRASRRVVFVSWMTVVALGLAATIAVTVRSVAWQDGLRLLMDMDPHVLWWQWTLVPIVAFVLCAFFVVVGRLIRLGARAVARMLSRFVRPRYALAAAATLTIVVVVGLVQGFLIRGVLDFAESSASLANGGTSAGIVQPTLPTQSRGSAVAGDLVEPGRQRPRLRGPNAQPFGHHRVHTCIRDGPHPGLCRTRLRLDAQAAR